MPLAKHFLLLVFFSITFFISGCSGGSNVPTPTAPVEPPQASLIPDTPAISPLAPLVAKPPLPAIAGPTQAILRHVHRNTVSGVLSPKGDYVDSDNAKVEKRGILGVYFDVERQVDNRYVIDPEDNGLAYFRVTNTKPNGSVRVHNFYGVVPGYYMTFDTTDVDFQRPENPLSACKKVDLRLVGLPTMSPSSRLLINGRLITDAVIEQNKAYLQQINLCPINLAKNYLVMVVIENSETDIRYGFNFYQDLAENDFLEVDLDQQAEIVPWTADHEIGNEFDLYGIQYGWQIFQYLYSSPERDNFSGTFPKFPALGLSSYQFSSDTTDLTSGVDINTREFTSELQSANFVINNIKLDNLSLNPLRLTWKNIGANRPKVISGLIFNTSFTQTYAFMSMDETVLNNEEFNFPHDNLSLLLDSTLVATTGAAGTESNDFQYLSQAALFTGFLYWPTEQTIGKNNSDLFITANGTALLQLILDNKIKP